MKWPFLSRHCFGLAALVGHLMNLPFLSRQGAANAGVAALPNRLSADNASTSFFIVTPLFGLKEPTAIGRRGEPWNGGHITIVWGARCPEWNSPTAVGTPTFYRRWSLAAGWLAALLNQSRWRERAVAASASSALFQCAGRSRKRDGPAVPPPLRPTRTRADSGCCPHESHRGLYTKQPCLASPLQISIRNRRAAKALAARRSHPPDAANCESKGGPQTPVGPPFLFWEARWPRFAFVRRPLASSRMFVAAQWTRKPSHTWTDAEDAIPLSYSRMPVP